VSLKKMVDHIYGRINIIQHNNRPHMFVKELSLYVTYWNELLQDGAALVDKKKQVYIENFHKNLINGITYYRSLSDKLGKEFETLGAKLKSSLDETERSLVELLESFLAKATN
ncbi:MAG TPA: hypothetical protein PKI08_05935, partial [Aquaticitalea sp.]|nr:hypothetical protein [Aquaticitalea sp.]